MSSSKIKYSSFKLKQLFKNSQFKTMSSPISSSHSVSTISSVKKKIKTASAHLQGRHDHRVVAFVDIPVDIFTTHVFSMLMLRDHVHFSHVSKRMFLASGFNPNFLKPAAWNKPVYLPISLVMGRGGSARRYNPLELIFNSARFTKMRYNSLELICNSARFTTMNLDINVTQYLLDMNPSLGRVHTLDLSRCRGITDVSTLGGVHTLDLSRCRGITDVSTLGGVHDLNLEGCRGITDVSTLGGVHELHLEGCRGITDVSTLGGVHTLDLSRCRGTTDVSTLGGVHDLNLEGCTSVTDVSTLGGIHTLNLSFCNSVTDVSALGGVHTLNLFMCTGINDVSALGGVHTFTHPMNWRNR
jgi:hypothetical protein